MATYAISDLHLHDEDQPFLFTAAKEAVFARLADEVMRGQGELIIAGDFIDFTGMENPPNGHAQFFEEVFTGADLKHPAIRQALLESGWETKLRQVALRFPMLTEKLGGLARARRLTILPGNHDCRFLERGAQGALARAIGAAEGDVRWKTRERVGNTLFAEHGHAFDPMNRTDGSCRNRGTAITSALYKALMPALTAFGVPERAVFAIPAVRPEENVVFGIQHYLSVEHTDRLVAAFVRLIVRNGYFTGWRRLLFLPLRHPVPWLSSYMNGFLKPERLVAALKDDSGLAVEVHRRAEAHRLTFDPPPRLVVLGHTHQLDQSRHYLNLGTWIDHVDGIEPHDLSKVDVSLPVLKLDNDGRCEVYDARELPRKSQLSDCRKVYDRTTVV